MRAKVVVLTAILAVTIFFYGCAVDMSSKTRAAEKTVELQNTVLPATSVQVVQPHAPQKYIVFTAEQLDEYEDKILNKVENFYNNRMNYLLWTMGVGLAIVGILVPMFLEGQRKRSFKRELGIQSRKFEKALAADSGIHFLEHAKGLPPSEEYSIDALCLVLLAIEKFAEAEEINGIYLCAEAIESLQLPRYSLGRDIEDQHNNLSYRYDMACTAIKESGFEKKLASQLKSVKTKIEEWYSNLPENRKSN